MTPAVVPVEPGHAVGLLELFTRAGSPCNCRFWHFAGDKNAWLDRCANAPGTNRDELQAEIAGAGAGARGMVALADGLVVAWMKLAPANQIPKVYEQRPFKGLPVLGDRDGALTVGCFLVDPVWRRRGLTRRLLDAGIAWARATDARAVDAFPRTSDAGHPEELWMGTVSAFEERGFLVLHGVGPYRAMRLDLRLPRDSG